MTNTLIASDEYVELIMRSRCTHCGAFVPLRDYAPVECLECFDKRESELARKAHARQLRWNRKNGKCASWRPGDEYAV